VNTDSVDSSILPTRAMLMDAARVSLQSASDVIDQEFREMLRRFSLRTCLVQLAPGERSIPSLRFTFTEQYKFAEGIEPPDSGFLLGCVSCRPQMAHNAGCEYTKLCECLEFAEVDEARLVEPKQIQQYQDFLEGRTDSTMGLPKYSPYTMKGRLQTKTMLSGFPIYECNQLCACGDVCKTKVTQKGRHARLEIFKTATRGWGLRSLDDLEKGEFIDFYWGEVITNQEADNRLENNAQKNSYLFDLDKFRKEINEDDMLVLDGEFFGGPTRFVNHSCDPNCGIYAVSYNKYDNLKYNLAFFARENIPKRTELTFDYAEGKNDDEDPESQGSGEMEEGRTKCLCGTPLCRGYLWL